MVGVATRVLKTFGGDAHEFSEDEAYVAGLLHDVGGLVLDQYLPRVLEQVQAVAREKGLPASEAETLVLRMDHGEIGAHLLRRWNLPESIVVAVEFHHQPENAPSEGRTLAQAVHLSDFVCTCLGLGDGGDGFTKGFSESAWHDLGLSVESIPKVMERAIEEATRCESLLTLL